MLSLSFKLTLAFLLLGLGGIALVGIVMWGTTSREFNRFVKDRGQNEYAAEVSRYYASNGSWAGIEQHLRERNLVYTNTTQQQVEGDTPPPPPFVLADQNLRVVVPFGPYQTGDQLPNDGSLQSSPVTVDGQTVGYVVLTGRQPRADSFESRFLDRIRQSMALALLGVGLLSILVGLLLARSITRPVRELTAATSAVAEGRLIQQVPVRSRDELGELTHAFNKMNADLQRSNNLRRQMTADIAHDLRSPLAVITGYLEGLKDGVLKPTQTRFAAMYDESVYLQRLVEDLRTLSLADAGELVMTPQRTQPGELIERIAAIYRPAGEDRGITIRAEVEAGLPDVQVDPDRVMQALGNLVNNAMRYTESGGEIVLAGRHTETGGAALEVCDNGAGIDPDVLPHVFERFYRGDSSRQDSGSGLGLAIARSIVELQNGKIQAASEGLGRGSRFTITFPAAPAQE